MYHLSNLFLPVEMGQLTQQVVDLQLETRTDRVAALITVDTKIVWNKTTIIVDSFIGMYL